MGGGGRAKNKKVFAQGKIKWKKNHAGQLTVQKYSCYGLKKIHTRNLITKKNSCGSKIPHPPHNFSNGSSLFKAARLHCLSDVFVAVAQHNPVLQCWNTVVTIRNNVATLCCAKNRCCESSRVTSPLAP